jgi:hypothetical protein
MMVKSTRHSKITGDFGESLVLYWLSRLGFECARIDHTGIDIIARDPKARTPMGISVKSRSRMEGTERDYVGIPNGDLEKVDAACAAFGCAPFFAIVVDAGKAIHGFLLPMKRLLDLFPRGKTVVAWKMGEQHLAAYAQDAEIMRFEFQADWDSIE